MAKLLFYQNGAFVTQVALGAVGSLSFAAATTYYAATSTGQANDMLWYNGKALSETEIADHYYDGAIPAADASTRILWRANEGAGAVLTSTPAGYNGALAPATWSTATRCRARTVSPARTAA